MMLHFLVYSIDWTLFKEYFVAVQNEKKFPKTEVFPALGKNN